MPKITFIWDKSYRSNHNSERQNFTKQKKNHVENHMVARGVARGGGRPWPPPPPPPRNLADKLTLFEPGWADFAPHTTTVRPPGFKKLSTPLIAKFVVFLLKMNCT